MRKVVIAFICLVLAACGPRDTRPDSEKFAQFHDQVTAIDKRVTAASDAYTRASDAAYDRKDRAALDKAAADLHASLGAIRDDAAAVKPPEFASPDARDQAKQVLAALLAGIDANQDAAEAIRRTADPHHPTTPELAAIQDAKDRVSSAALTETNAMFDLNASLGGAK